MKARAGRIVIASALVAAVVAGVRLAPFAGAPAGTAPVFSATPSASPSASPTTRPSPTASSTPTRSPDAFPTTRPCGSGRLIRFRVAVDEGLDITPATFARQLRSVLCSPRSWIASGRVRFAFHPSGSLLIGLRTPDEAERRCKRITGGLSVRRFYSCGSVREIALNSDRWFGGSPYWPGPLADYRRMLTNHEVGHALRQSHSSCPRDGALAPIMMQQSKGVKSGSRTCRPNPWPLASELARVR